MRSFIRVTLFFGIVSLATHLLSACAGVSGPGHVMGNEKGSAPANNAEVPEYKKAVLRCYKSGGSRVVKIEGRLRCY